MEAKGTGPRFIFCALVFVQIGKLGWSATRVRKEVDPVSPVQILRYPSIAQPSAEDATRPTV